jgi:UDP-glucose 4-epimerase
MVTGGCGFIGSHLVRRLVADGARRIVVVDSLRYGDPANLGEQRRGVEVVRHVLGSDDPAALADALRGVRALFHLAAEKHNQSKDSPLDVLRSNILGTHTLFDLAARAGVEKIVFSSSLYAYGRLRGAPFREDEVPRPTTLYGITKLCGEHLLDHLHAVHGTASNVLRFLFVYGPRQFAGMGYKSVIVKTFERLLAGRPAVVNGDGSQALDYVYVDDVVDATVRALESELSGEVLNVGTGVPTTINQLVDLMRSIAGSSLATETGPPDWTAGSSRVADVSKVRRLLRWEPCTTLREGLERTFRWISEQPGTPAPL